MSYFFLFVYSLQSLAEDRTALLFPLDKNQAQILPQSFEFEMLGNSIIRIGDVLLNTQLMNLKINRNSSGNLSLSIKAPGGLITSGQFVFKNETGKIIFSQNINLSEGQKLPMQRSAGSRFESMRFEVTGLVLNDFPDAKLQELKKSKFFTFCIQASEKLARVSLCSSPLVLKESNQSIQVVNNSSNQNVKKAFINGQLAGAQGIIFLQNPKESITAVFEMGSFATLDFSTKYQPLDLRISKILPETKKIQIQGRGVQVSDAKTIIEQNPNFWVVELNFDRPIIYLRGEAQIPLKQEFVILDAHIKPPLVEALTAMPVRTYSSSPSIELESNANLKIEPADKNSTVIKKKNNQFEWNIENLKKEGPEKRLLKVIDGKNTWIAQADFERGRRKVGELHLGSSLSHLRFEYWINTRMGISLQNNILLMKKSTDASWNQNSLQFLYRWSKGFAKQDKSSEIQLGYQMISYNTDAISASFSGPTLFLTTYLTSNLKLGLGMALSSASSTQYLKLNSYMQLYSHYEINFRKYSTIQIGVKAESFSVTTTATLESVATSRPQAYLGFSTVF